jgi:bifunctional DNase/RNase
VLSIWVGDHEAKAISQQIENITTQRPMTHDLLRNVIADLDGAVEQVVVSDLRDRTFYAIICLNVRGERVLIDARPSDAIALALRTKSPILVDDAVIASAKALDSRAREEPGRTPAALARRARPRGAGPLQDVIVGRPTSRPESPSHPGGRIRARCLEGVSPPSMSAGRHHRLHLSLRRMSAGRHQRGRQLDRSLS